VDEYNRQANEEIESVRDFVVLHYHATARTDSAFWQHCQQMPIPESLAYRIQLFKETGRTFIGSDELFRVDSWTQVMLGQGIMPQAYHPMVNNMPEAELTRFLEGFRANIEKNIALMPSHADFIKSYCAMK
jgi:tryptophan 7-halogenase